MWFKKIPEPTPYCLKGLQMLKSHPSTTIVVKKIALTTIVVHLCRYLVGCLIGLSCLKSLN